MLPFYGDADHFRLAVQSVLAQTDGHFRLVCVDDAFPSDDPRRWLESLKDPRLVYVRNDENLGVARNFAHCLDLVEAPWFVMMGGDDIMHPTYIETVRSLARDSACAVIQPGVVVIDADGHPVLPLADRLKALIRPRSRDEVGELRGEALARSLARGDWAYFPSLLWRTDAVRPHGFDQRYEIALDLALLFDLALDDQAMLISDATCFSYRRHSSSASSITAVDGLRFAQERELLEGYAERFARKGWRRAERAARLRLLPRLNAGSVAAGLALRGLFSDAWRVLRFCIR
ncbi:glycosyltransferase family A protein [uncultured Microbacterium sp.]|uniref:glycosyltransferase family 2 protein n=1 Tax=uncultured Microbacterium sp. TaxID=191216 RepID=UPI0025F19721|nr:glycosyltransferase family A protein [uncultured Microbacterium sp.]